LAQRVKKCIVAHSFQLVTRAVPSIERIPKRIAVFQRRQTRVYSIEIVQPVRETRRSHAGHVHSRDANARARQSQSAFKRHPCPERVPEQGHLDVSIRLIDLSSDSCRDLLNTRVNTEWFASNRSRSTRDVDADAPKRIPDSFGKRSGKTRAPAARGRKTHQHIIDVARGRTRAKHPSTISGSATSSSKTGRPPRM
jgi:hypothetical protein